MSKAAASLLDQAHIAFLRADLGSRRNTLDGATYKAFADMGFSKTDLDRLLNIMAKRGEVVFSVGGTAVGVQQIKRSGK